MALYRRSPIPRLLVGGLMLVGAACADVTPPKDVLHLEGTVRDGTNNTPIQGAVVLTGSISGDLFLSRRISGTDAQGRYSIDDECLGNDYIKVLAPAYRDLMGPVECGPGRRTIDIALFPQFNP